MKFLLCLLGGVICAGYFFTRQQTRVNVQEAIENRGAIVGMTQVDVRRSLGEPLMTKTVEKLLGNETMMTFADGNEVTFRSGKAVRIQSVKMSDEFAEARKSVVNRRDGTSPNAKSRLTGTALDRAPYTTRNGEVFYSGNADGSKLGTITESERRQGMYGKKK